MKHQAWGALCLALAIFVCGCGDEEPYTPPKGGAAMGATKTEDLTKTDAKSPDPKKDGKAMDIGNAGNPTGTPETSTMPDLSTEKNADGTPNVEFEKPGGTVEKPPTPAPSHVNWTPAKQTPESVAASADQAMAGLTDTLADIPILAAYGDLKGRIACQLKVRNAKTYWVRYAQFENGGPHAVLAVSNGTEKTRVGGATGKKMTPDQSDAIPSGARLADAWLIDMPRIVLSQWVSGKPIFTDLVKAFKEAGFEVQTDTMRTVRPEHTYVQDRLIISRPASQKKEKGEAKTVLIFDHDRGLPVTIEVATAPVKQPPVKMLWRAQWRFHNPFPDNQFAVASKSTKSS